MAATCPRCNGVLECDGDQGIVDYDNEWDAQAERYRCPNGHTIFVVDTNRTLLDADDDMDEDTDAD